MATTEYIREWRDKRRRSAIERLGGACVFCGSKEQLEFDHIDPNTKITNIGRLWTASADVFEKELAKCQLLCKKCHISKTTKELTKPIQHGTLSGYIKKKCRCAECMKVGSAYQVEWKKKKKKKLKNMG